MASFHYVGRTSLGEKVEGIFDGANPEAVANRLSEKGITPLEIEEHKEAEKLSEKIEDLLGLETVSEKEIMMLCRQMHTISRSGIPLIKALLGLAGTSKNRVLRAILLDIVEQLEAGSNLATGFRRHPKVFSQLFVAMIEAGENSGQLEETFKQISVYVQNDIENKKRLKSALRYPFFVFVALLIAIVIVNIKVIPAFTQMFERFNTELPIATRILIGMSNLFVNYWPIILMVAVSIVVAIQQFMKTDKGKRYWGRKKLGLPLVGLIIKQASMARYARGFALMMKSGVPINKALGLVSAAMDNLYLCEQVLAIRNGIERGDGLLQSHSQRDIFSPLVLQMIGVGEESGRVEELLEEVAHFYEDEVDYDLKNLSATIEPIMIVIMAVFVMILALGIFVPMWDMLTIQQK